MTTFAIIFGVLALAEILIHHYPSEPASGVNFLAPRG